MFYFSFGPFFVGSRGVSFSEDAASGPAAAMEFRCLSQPTMYVDLAVFQYIAACDGFAGGKPTRIISLLRRRSRIRE
jgi:hypothetical protein